MNAHRTARGAVLAAAVLFGAGLMRGGAASADAVTGAREGRAVYWVFLTGRVEPLAKAARLADLGRRFSTRALDRRARRGAVAGVSATDLPVDARARADVLASGARLRVESRWLNALSVEATAAEIARVAALPGVASVHRVSHRAARRPDGAPAPSPTVRAELSNAPPSTRSPSRRSARDVTQLDYGGSKAQLEQIGVTNLHQDGLSGAGTIIGVLDTGFNLAHPGLIDAVVIAQRDFVNGDDNTADEPGESSWWHGTNVLSTIAGFDPGDLIGAAYGASFVLGKTENVAIEDSVEEDYWVAGLEWAESLGVDVVSSSLGYNGWYVYEEMDGATAVTTVAARMAVERGVVVVNAMGNEQSEAWRYMLAPADAEEVISVGAVNANGALASFSSLGPTADGRIKPDVVALGVGDVVAFAGGGYITSSGTSFATPLVAGVAALILEAHPNYTPAQVQLALRETATQCASPDTEIGWGVVRADVAVAHAIPGSGCSTVPIDTTDSEPPLVGSPISRPRGDLFAPARGALDWSYALAATGALECRLYDVAGRMLATILDGEFAAGDVAIAWDGRLDSGDDAPSGVYFVRAESSAGVDTERLVLVR